MRCILGILVLVLVSVFTSTSSGEFLFRCLPMDAAASYLKQHNYYLLGTGVAHTNRGLIRIYISIGGNWIATVTGVNGRTCIEGRGYGWQGEQPCFADST